ncbi:hypothetical protein C8Q75DRAFT_896185 [Abortiporus biennis]|nr:hypothetical protein C8Q75DRAFT_896255 [Abortiporus biennis]KAI0782025.1 hypothetical protein C8Q75DRAFT_896185 [Abortiporus biennis]
MATLLVDNVEISLRISDTTEFTEGPREGHVANPAEIAQGEVNSDENTGTDRMPNCGRSFMSMLFLNEFWDIRRIAFMIEEDPESVREIMNELLEDKGGFHGPVTLSRVIQKSDLTFFESSTYNPNSIHRGTFPRHGNLSHIQDDQITSLDWQNRHISLNALKKSLLKREVFDFVAMASSKDAIHTLDTTFTPS